MDRRRIFVLTIALLLPLAGLEARLVHLQLVASKTYLGDLNARRRSLEIATPARGTIYDRTGKKLAYDERAFDLYLVLDEFEKDPDAFERLAPLLPVTDLQRKIEIIYEKIERQLNLRPKRERLRILARERRAPYLVERGLDFDVAMTIETGGDRYPGTVVREGLKREYPFGTAGCHFVGYLGLPSQEECDELARTGTEGFAAFIGEEELDRLVGKGIFHDELLGRAGIEKTYNTQLRGKYGLMIFEREPGKSREMVELIPAIAGQDLHLTVDIDVQKFVENLLIAECPTDAAAVVLDPHTGEVIALVSNRLYDPNAPGSYVTDTVNKPMRSRAFGDHAQLGSVFKIVPATAGLENRIVTGATEIECKGKFRPELVHYNCHIWNGNKFGMHGPLKLADAMAKSCNIFFYTIGEQVGVDGLKYWAEQFGLGSRTGLDVPGEAPGSLPKRDALSSAIGQGELMVTPLQVAVMMSVIANGGKRVTPHLRRGGGLPPVATILESSTIEYLRASLVEVVRHGTARDKGLEKWKIAGKTGTAQTGRDREDHAWFAGYFPHDAPKYAVVVLVEHAGHGGDIAAPLVEKIAERLTMGAPAGTAPE